MYICRNHREHFGNVTEKGLCFVGASCHWWRATHTWRIANWQTQMEIRCKNFRWRDNTIYAFVLYPSRHAHYYYETEHSTNIRYGDIFDNDSHSVIPQHFRNNESHTGIIINYVIKQFVSSVTNSMFTVWYTGIFIVPFFFSSERWEKSCEKFFSATPFMTCHKISFLLRMGPRFWESMETTQQMSTYKRDNR